MTDIKVERLKNLKQAKAKDLVKSTHSAKGTPHRVNKLVEEVMTRISKDLEPYQNADGSLFKIVSGYRDAQEQKAIWDRETKKLENIIADETKKKAEKSKKFNRKRLIEAEYKLAHLDMYIARPAEEGEKKVTPHMTGLVVDVDLGFPIKKEFISQIEKSDAYDKFSRYAYHTYKMAPYDVEPWHWECGDACQKNIKDILDKEKKAGGVKTVSNTPLPPPMPKSAFTDSDPHDLDLDCDGVPIVDPNAIIEKEEREITTERSPTQKVLTIFFTASMMCGIHYLIQRNKNKYR